MINQKNSKIFKLITAVIIVTLLSTNAWALVWANYSSEAYIASGERSTPIESYVVNGASGFLQSYSNWLVFLNKIELSQYNGLDYSELQSILTAAIENMDAAKTAYTDLTRETELMPYNREVIGTLASFNYKHFEKVNVMNQHAFSEVQGFLKKGNVRAVYHKLLRDIEGISNMLTALKINIDAGQFPPLSDLYRINQSYSHASLFGQYVAEVFREIKK